MYRLSEPSMLYAVISPAALFFSCVEFQSILATMLDPGDDA
jgi:hypothetical protein